MEGKREGIEREGWNGSRGKKGKDEMWTGKLRPLSQISGSALDKLFTIV